MSTEKLRAQIADIQRQLAIMDSSRQFWSWQAAYLPILQKSLREFR